MTHPAKNSSQTGSSFPVILLVIAILVGGAAAWFYFSKSEEATVTPPPVEEVKAPEAEPEEPPPARAVVEDMKTDGKLDDWLAIPSIVQRIAAATWRVSNGESPAPVLGFLGLSGRFEVRDEGDKTYIDPAAYARYDGIIDRIVAVDPVQAGEAYKRLMPNFDAAFRQIAEPGQTFSSVAQQAVQNVLAVEVPQGDIQVIGKGATFFYADEGLESLSSASKHVLRLGPKNAGKLQAWLRKAANAGGVR